jgi:putative copper resistance protein D
VLAEGFARGLHMAGSFALFGTCGIAAVLLPREIPTALARSLNRLAWGSFFLLAAAGILWFILETADMAGAQSFLDVWAALPLVAGQTRFGELLIGRGFFLLLAALSFHFGYRRIAAVLAGAAVITEAWLSHGGAMTGATGNLLLLSSICHLASGGAWLGSLPALRAGIRALPIVQAAQLARRFSPIGMICVAGLILSAIVQYVFLIGGPAMLFKTSYGLTASFKILCLATLMALALINRTRLTPSLGRAEEAARKTLLRSIGAATVIGFLAVLAAGALLQQTPPAMALMLKQQGGS